MKNRLLLNIKSYLLIDDKNEYWILKPEKCEMCSKELQVLFELPEKNK